MYGREYYFVTRDRFEEMIGDGFFIEYTEYTGNLYGWWLKFALFQSSC